MGDTLKMVEQEKRNDVVDVKKLKERVKELEDMNTAFKECQCDISEGEVKHICGFLQDSENEVQEEKARQYCEENGLKFDEAADYAKAVSATVGRSDYYSPLGFVGGSMGPQAAKGIADSVNQIAMARRDIQRIRRFDMEFKQIMRDYDSTFPTKPSAARKQAAEKFSPIYERTLNTLEHPVIKTKFHNAFKKLDNKIFRMNADYKLVQQVYDAEISQNMLLNWAINTSR